MEYETRTTKSTDVCIPCGFVFIEDNDYDTLGSDSGICCPDCGSEQFTTVAQIIKQRDVLLMACEKLSALARKYAAKGYIDEVDAEAKTIFKAIAEAEKE